MRLSSGLVAPAAVVLLSTTMLCLPGSAAVSQTAGPSTSLPSVTVVEPKHVATPRHSHAINAGAGRRTARAIRAPDLAATRAPAPAATGTPAPQPGSVMAKLAALERTSSNCTDGCQTSFKYGNQPWNGCSTTADVFSATCRNVRNFKTYAECSEFGRFTGWRPNEVWWYCTSLLAGKYKVAELKRPGH
jgi:hypothetical protein